MNVVYSKEIWVDSQRLGSGEITQSHLSNKYQLFLGFGLLLEEICQRIFIHCFPIDQVNSEKY